MSTNGAPSMEELMSAAVRLPHHVVSRAFPAETVVLNLETGRYHSLNPVGGRFLEVLALAASVREGLGRLQAEFGDQDPASIAADVREFCVDLLDRGLIALGEGR